MVASTHNQGTVLLKSADELKAFSKGEEELLESQVRDIHAAGVKVVVSGKLCSQILSLCSQEASLAISPCTISIALESWL